MKDYYYILGVKEQATSKEIKGAYRKLSIKFHPDKNKNDVFFERRFKELLEAYETLINVNKRIIYDSERRNFLRGEKKYRNQKVDSKPKIILFKANRNFIQEGSNIEISWYVKNVDKILISCLSGFQESSGSKQVIISDFKQNEFVDIKITGIQEQSGITIEDKIRIKRVKERFNIEYYERFKKETLGNIFDDEYEELREDLKDFLFLTSYYDDIREKLIRENEEKIIDSIKEDIRFDVEEELYEKFYEELSDEKYDEALGDIREELNSKWKEELKEEMEEEIIDELKMEIREEVRQDILEDLESEREEYHWTVMSRFEEIIYNEFEAAAKEEIKKDFDYITRALEKNLEYYSNLLAKINDRDYVSY